MTLQLGINCGFLTVAPTTDPTGNTTLNVGSGVSVTKDTSPANSVKITEIGWYAQNATSEQNFEIALYADSAGVAGAQLFQDITNAKGTTAGWKTVTVDWAISADTDYWIALQVDGTAQRTDRQSNLGSGIDNKGPLNSLEFLDPYNGGALLDADDVLAFYAVVEISAGTNTQINIGDVWKEISAMQINIGDTWKAVAGMQINIGDAWKTIF